MPLTGKPEHDIPVEMAAGKPQKQAVAIALSKEREMKGRDTRSCGTGADSVQPVPVSGEVCPGCKKPVDKNDLMIDGECWRCNQKLLATDVEGYTEGGTFHPISGSKGYSPKKAGGKGHTARYYKNRRKKGRGRAHDAVGRWNGDEYLLPDGSTGGLVETVGGQTTAYAPGGKSRTFIFKDSAKRWLEMECGATPAESNQALRRGTARDAAGRWVEEGGAWFYVVGGRYVWCVEGSAGSWESYDEVGNNLRRFTDLAAAKSYGEQTLAREGGIAMDVEPVVVSTKYAEKPKPYPAKQREFVESRTSWAGKPLPPRPEGARLHDDFEEEGFETPYGEPRGPREHEDVKPVAVKPVSVKDSRNITCPACKQSVHTLNDKDSGGKIREYYGDHKVNGSYCQTSSTAVNGAVKDGEPARHAMEKPIINNPRNDVRVRPV